MSPRKIKNISNKGQDASVQRAVWRQAVAKCKLERVVQIPPPPERQAAITLCVSGESVVQKDK
jgi:hypothetical protein